MTREEEAAAIDAYTIWPVMLGVADDIEGTPAKDLQLAEQEVRKLTVALMKSMGRSPTFTHQLDHLEATLRERHSPAAAEFGRIMVSLLLAKASDELRR